MTWNLISGDCLNVLPTLEESSIDACVTDPPYGLTFMGSSWDHGVPGVDYWREVFRVLKPGGWLLAFGGTRTHHRLMSAIEDAGFVLKDCLMWMFGSGFPKALNISKAIDKAAGAEREVVGPATHIHSRGKNTAFPKRPGETTAEESGRVTRQDSPMITAPATPEAKLWEGWHSALKPAYEPIIMAMKPLDGTFAHNALTHGVAGLNIDGCRIAFTKNEKPPTTARRRSSQKSQKAPMATRILKISTAQEANALGRMARRGSPEVYMQERPSENIGRWPANVILSHHPDCKQKGIKQIKAITGGSNPIRRSGAHADAKGHQAIGRAQTHHSFDDGTGKETVENWECHPDCPARLLDEQTGTLTSGKNCIKKESGSNRNGNTSHAFGAECRPSGTIIPTYGDSGGASRFFYCAKTSRKERTCGGTVDNPHPTVKPVSLMRWLCRLVSTPMGGTILDPFAGSGSTGIAAMAEGLDFVGIEIEESYAKTARKRLEASEPRETVKQGSLFDLIGSLD